LPELIDPQDEKALSDGLDVAMTVATPISDVRSTRDYRAAMIRTLARRAVGIAAQRAREGSAE
jgi:carbon-monoxide dehydrogenase medium subunit